MSVVHPIHTEVVGLANVRFFRPPSGGREFPHVSIEDLFQAMTMPRALRRHFMTSFRSSPWAKDAKAVPTADGIVVIVPHFVIQGLVDGMIEVGRCPPDFYGRYAVASAKAMSRLTDGLHGDALMAYLQAAIAAIGGLS